MRHQNKKAAAKAQAFLSQYKASVGCAKCGEKFEPCLHMHHVDPNTKKGKHDTACHVVSMAKAIRMIRECIVLCASCHIKLHHGFFDERVPALSVRGQIQKEVDEDQLQMFSGTNGHDTTA